MAIKGKTYTKTSWAFQERPVASAKLNLWDDRIEAALETLLHVLSLAWGGGDGVLRGATPDDLAVQSTDPPTLTVRVAPGWAFISRMPFRLASPVTTPVIIPPQQRARIDLVQACLSTWDVSVKTGSEAVAPTPPSPDADAIPLAHLYLRPGMNTIQQQDDNTNGYIIDARTFL